MTTIVEELRAVKQLDYCNARDWENLQSLAQRAADEIERLQSIVGIADAGPSFAEITKGLPRRSHEDASREGTPTAGTSPGNR